MASRRGQGIWTEGPNVPYTTYKMPEVNRPTVVPPPNVNSGASRNYGGTPENLNTVSSRYRPYRPPIRPVMAYLSEEVEYLDPDTGLYYHGRPKSGQTQGGGTQQTGTASPTAQSPTPIPPTPLQYATPSNVSPPGLTPTSPTWVNVPPPPGAQGSAVPTAPTSKKKAPTAPWTGLPPTGQGSAVPTPPSKAPKTGNLNLPPLTGTEAEDPFIAQIRNAEPKQPTQWAGPEATADVLDLTKPYSPAKAQDVAEAEILDFLKGGKQGRRQGSKRAKST